MSYWDASGRKAATKVWAPRSWGPVTSRWRGGRLVVGKPWGPWGGVLGSQVALAETCKGLKTPHPIIQKQKSRAGRFKKLWAQGWDKPGF